MRQKRRVGLYAKDSVGLHHLHLAIEFPDFNRLALALISNVTVVNWLVYQTRLEVEYTVPPATLAPRVERGSIPGPPGAMSLACNFRAISTSAKGASRAQKVCALPHISYWSWVRRHSHSQKKSIPSEGPPR